MNNNYQHLLRYGTHAEKDFFLEEYSNGFFDLALLNGNMLAYSVGAMSSFVLRLQKPFLIDPQTHAFQQDIEYLFNSKSDKPKMSLLKLSKSLGGPLTNFFDDPKSITYQNFSSKNVKSEFTKGVIDFQLKTIKEKIFSKDESKYVKYALEKEGSGLSEDNITPHGIIPPYFYITDENFDDWLNLNLEFIDIANEYVKNKSIKVFSQLVISKEVLRDKASRKKIIEGYSVSRCNNILLWVDSFVEDEVSKNDLNDFISLITDLASNGIKVYNLYGGYFSILLTRCKKGLAGVCHGLEYGESRPVVPVGGGVPISKYYFPPLHKRLRYADFLKILKKKGWDQNITSKEFTEKICKCLQCNDLKKFQEAKTFTSSKGISREYPTVEAKEHSLKHYLENKKIEFILAREKTKDELIAFLKNAYSEYFPILGQDLVGHLKRWEEVLKILSFK